MGPVVKKENAKSLFVILDITLQYHTKTKKFPVSMIEFSVHLFAGNLVGIELSVWHIQRYLIMYLKL
jgi:hypothetical protein